MQLKQPPAIRRALALAACSLVTAPAARAQGSWELDSTLLLYGEQDRVKVVEPIVRMKRQISEDEHVTVQFAVDAITGASPNGAVPAATPQTFTAPSGDSRYTTRANEIPLDPTVRDLRAALSFEWGLPFTRERRIVLQGHVAKEYDYASTGLGATLSQDFNNRNTTLAAGLSIGYDRLDPLGGVPAGLTPMPVYPATKATTGDSDDKQLADVLIGVTQILSRTTLVQLNYTYGQESGYLTDPYKLISVVDAGGNPVATLHEKRPEDRVRQAIYGRAITAIGKDRLNASYRYYWDDWGTRAHTVDFNYRFELGGGHYLEPQLRYSLQSQAADFYRPFLRQGETVEFASADYRLAEMTTSTVGIKYGVPTRKGEFGVRAAYMLQTGDDHPANAPGQLAAQDLFPDTKALIFQVNYSFLF